MAKRALALILCFVMLALALAGCAKKDEDDLGAYIYMYLTDMVYDLDPAHAYENESNLKVVSLLFDNLFVLDENGKVKKSLADSYTISEDDKSGEYKMSIVLNDTCWTDGVAVSANDVVYAWKRILEMDHSSEAASLLFDVKNARAVTEGEASIDDLGVYAVNEKTVEILFEGKIDYDQFLLNLTSYALVPLREEIVSKSDDWAKKPSTICTSGPFRLREVVYGTKSDEKAGKLERMVFERNVYYYRDIQEDKIDKSVKPYRIIIDYSKTEEEIMQLYNDGKLFFVGDIPLSVRGAYADKAEIKDALSTHTYIPNQNAIIRYYNKSDFKDLSTNETFVRDANGNKTVQAAQELKEGVDGDKIFANADVRKALSLAINRDAIAEAIVFADAATGIIPNGVFEANSAKKTFREIGGELIKSSANLDEAKALLEKAGVKASKYMFTISVAAYDDVHMKIAEMVKASWEELGFHVAINAIDVADNWEVDNVGEIPKDIMDDFFAEYYRAGVFEVAAVDQVALSADAFSSLAKYALEFSGQALSMVQADNGTVYEFTPHISGYNSENYNKKIEEAFAQKDIAARAAILHEAEKMLVDDAVVIPIIFNKTATLQNKDLSKVTATYYDTFNFKKAKLKDYELYVPVETQ